MNEIADKMEILSEEFRIDTGYLAPHKEPEFRIDDSADTLERLSEGAKLWGVWLKGRTRGLEAIRP